MTDTHKTKPATQTSASGQKVDATGQSDASRAAATTAAPAASTTAAPAADADKAKPATEGAEGRGRKSQYAGMRLRATVETNTRREGTHGHKSLGIIMDAKKDGILYEDYIKKGGRLNDLVWDINKDNVEATKA